MWTTVVIMVGCLWLLISLASYYLVRKAFKKYRNYPRMEVPVSMEPTVRKDFGKWDEAAIIRGCFIRLPFHFFMLGSFLLFYAIIVWLQPYLRYPEALINFYRSRYGRLACHSTFNLVEQFDASEEIRTPIVIANHVCWIDFIYMGTCISRASFVAKKEVEKVPVFAPLAKYLKTLLVDRSSAEARQKIKEQIGQRVEEYQNDPNSTYPLIIYPEGTVTNGRSIISFKNGAFDPLCPITIFCLKYENKQFHMGLDEVDTIYHATIILALNYTLRVYKDVITPLPTDTIESYRERCRDRMVELSGFKKYDTDYKEILEYQRSFREFLKQKRQQNTQ